MKHTLYEYRNKLCSGEDYIKDNYIGKDDNGEVLPIEIRPERFLYAIKRTLRDYDDVEYTEYKVYDLESEYSACIQKDKSYLEEPVSLKKYWENLLKFNSEIKNYIDSRIEFGD